MFFRAFIGWSAPDIGRPIQDGIPGITGAVAQEGKSPAPGWNMTHFKLVKSAGTPTPNARPRTMIKQSSELPGAVAKVISLLLI